MTNEDLDRIEAELDLKLPSAYRTIMAARSEELKEITYKKDGVTLHWFANKLACDADQVIELNLSQRKKRSVLSRAVPNWSESIFLIGSNETPVFFTFVGRVVERSGQSTMTLAIVLPK